MQIKTREAGGRNQILVCLWSLRCLTWTFKSMAPSVTFHFLNHHLLSSTCQINDLRICPRFRLPTLPRKCTRCRHTVAEFTKSLSLLAHWHLGLTGKDYVRRLWATQLLITGVESCEYSPCSCSRGLSYQDYPGHNCEGSFSSGVKDAVSCTACIF